MFKGPRPLMESCMFFSIATFKKETTDFVYADAPFLFVVTPRYAAMVDRYAPALLLRYVNETLELNVDEVSLAGAYWFRRTIDKQTMTIVSIIEPAQGLHITDKTQSVLHCKTPRFVDSSFYTPPTP